MRLDTISEVAQLEDKYTVLVSGYDDHPQLSIPGLGRIRLLFSGDHWVVHNIRGEKAGAGTVLYFAALWWAMTVDDRFAKDTYGKVASDLTLSPDALRARRRMQTQYGDYLYLMPHPDLESVKVHRGDGTDWRRPAESEEAMMWRLKKEPPFAFEYKSI